MRLIVLGSAAGGGVPQWNCACSNCASARIGGDVEPRTQDSVAVSADARRWVLLNTSSDVVRQLEATPEMWPVINSRSAGEGTVRGASPLAAVVLTNGDLDHCLGLLSLREWTPYSLYATEETQSGLFERNVVFRTLNRQRPHLVRRDLPLDDWTPLLDAGGGALGLSIRAFPVPGKLPLHLEPFGTSTPGTNVGLLVEQASTGARLAYVPGVGAVSEWVRELDSVGCLLLDGTFFRDDELCEHGAPGKTARSMAHVPMDGRDGTLETLAHLSVPFRYFTHVNNTNPVLNPHSEERRAIRARGWKVATDGLRLEL